jgi:hypothetical protein
MDTSTISLGQVVAAVFTAAAAGVGWLLKNLFEKVDMLEKDLNNHKLRSAEIFVTRGELEKNIDEFKRSLSAIHFKLDTMVDQLAKKTDRE